MANRGRWLGHHIPMALLGPFILVFGRFGLNAASTFSAIDIQVATIASSTAIAAALGAIVAMCWAIKRTGKPDPGTMANGMLAGLGRPVGAISVHGVCGTCGVLAVGLGANGSYGGGPEPLGGRGCQGLVLGRRRPVRRPVAGCRRAVDRDPRRALRHFQDPGHHLQVEGQGREADELEGLVEPEVGVLAYPELVGRHVAADD